MQLSIRFLPTRRCCYSIILVLALTCANAKLAAQIRFSGTFAYSAVGTTVAFGVSRIDNFNLIGSRSGTLAIQLWATTFPYTGFTNLFGNRIAEVELGTLLGGYYLSPVARTTILSNLPSPGYYNIVFVLAEWNGFQWVTVDHGNFPAYQLFGVVAPPPIVTPPPPTVSPPVIVIHPVPLSLNEGGSGTLFVSVTGTPPFGFQWFRNGVAIPGKTEVILTLANVQIAESGSYTVRVSNEAGSMTSNVSTVTVIEQLRAPVIINQPANQSIPEGSKVTFTVTVASSVGLQYVWTRNGVEIPGATFATLILNNVRQNDEGLYEARISNIAGSTTSIPASLKVQTKSTLSNLSVRTSLATGQTLTLGAVVSGVSKQVLVRAAGPALNKFGLVGLNDPRIDLFQSGSTPSATNNDWDSSLSPIFSSVGAFAFDAGSKDAAILEILNGAFTVQANGTGPGTILVEAYDVSGGTNSKLVNVSARNYVGTGDNILIAGFAISGSGTKQLLIRAIGPALRAFGVDRVLADPVVTIFDSQSKSLNFNDNWNSSLSSVFSQVGAFPLPVGSLDSAMVVTLPAGAAYTVQVTGVNGGTGEALVEVYEIP